VSASERSDGIPVTIAGVRAAVVERHLSCEELARAHLARAVAAEDNAFISLGADGVLAAARAADAVHRMHRREEPPPLLGVCIAVKDNIHVAGVGNTAGTPGLAHYVPSNSARTVSRLVDAGAIVVGKTNMHELALGTTSVNAAYGAVRNPRDPERIAGGSSGGTAAAVACGAAVAGLGTDTGGSVRIPSCVCGICGFRPSVRRYPRDGITPNSWTRDTVGPMAHSVEDLVLLDAVLSGERADAVPPPPTTLRLGVPGDAFTTDLDRDVARRWLSALDRLQASGVTIIDVSMREIAEANEAVGMPTALYEIPRALKHYLREHDTGVTFDEVVKQIASPDVAELFEDAIVDGAPNLVSEIDYREALERERPRLKRLYRNLFAKNDIRAVALPTTPLPAVRIDAAHVPVRLGTQTLAPWAAYRRNTEPSSNAGIPSVTVRLDTDADALPLGFEIDGPDGDDRRLLRIAETVEAILTPQLLQERVFHR
jgi:Asp-tRNA(Asn)/Glu-tRNA(Gln) amidotransferase A subunit family amidase